MALKYVADNSSKQRPYKNLHLLQDADLIFQQVLQYSFHQLKNLQDDTTGLPAH